jgi:DNA-binding winged helix-turn-helix (wHTH) protein
MAGWMCVISSRRTYSTVVKPPSPSLIRFGVFQLDVQAGQLLKGGRVVRLKPQPFKLLQLLVSRAGEVVTRDDIREALWGTETFVDFEQGVNSAIKQVREALGEDADRPLYIETVPKRGYRFTAPIEGPPRRASLRTTDLNLHKALWLNIAELKIAEQHRLHRRRLLTRAAAGALAAVVGAIVAMLIW